MSPEQVDRALDIAQTFATLMQFWTVALFAFVGAFAIKRFK